MTAQTLDTIFYRGNEYWLSSEPLEGYKQLPQFLALSTANHKGYTAAWAVVGEYLFIVSLSGALPDAAEASLETIFPGCQAPVLAEWYSGELRMQRGRLLSPAEFCPLFEIENILSIESGRIKGCRTLHRQWVPERRLDPILFRPVEELDDVCAESLAKLKTANILRIGDLIHLTAIKLIRMANLDVGAIEEIEEVLASRGLVLGMRVEGWPPKISPDNLGLPTR